MRKGRTRSEETERIEESEDLTWVKGGERGEREEGEGRGRGYQNK